VSENMRTYSPKERPHGTTSCRVKATPGESSVGGGRTPRLAPLEPVRALDPFPAVLGGFALDGFVVLDVAGRELLDAPLPVLHDVLQLVHPQARVLERDVAVAK